LIVLQRSGFDGSTKFSDLAIVPEPRLRNRTGQFEMGRVKSPLANASERRVTRRFKVLAPMTLTIGDREVSAYTRDLSNRGAYFYLAFAQSALIDLDFEFVVELPPEITLSTGCRIQCRARLLRKEKTSRSLSGIAAEILDYSILGQAASTA
jgi:hypothetical protein